jgi:phosphatidylglycerol:prolipoprotein diacylglycerol transferase
VYPKLFTVGPFTVYSFGLMLGLGFILADLVLASELKRKKIDPQHASTIILLAVVFGIIGSKALSLIETWDDFMRHPMEMAFSPGGLTWYGGFFLATVAIYFYVRRSKLSFAQICDSSAPGLAIAYGVARIGCHLSGDGDYGVPTSLPWGTMYSKGTFPPSLAFKDFPEIVAKYGVNGVVPDTILVHPAPVYEFILGVAIFFILWSLRKKPWRDGRMFMLYLMLSGAARLGVEFIRINPRLLFGLSEAQLIAIVVIVIGVVGFARLGDGGPRSMGTLNERTAAAEAGTR